MCVCDGGTDCSVVLLLKFCRQLFTFEKGSDESWWVVRGGGWGGSEGSMAVEDKGRKKKKARKDCRRSEERS